MSLSTNLNWVLSFSIALIIISGIANATAESERAMIDNSIKSILK